MFCVAGVVVLAYASRVEAQGRGQAAGQTAEQQFKNIQVLKGTPAGELNQSMHVINAALGVVCEFCHADGEGPAAGRELDVKPQKAVARKMMQMMMDMNRTQFGGRQVVTCFTCHRGSAIPVAIPEMVSFTEPKTVTTPVLPTVDQILAKYVAALGGEAALRKVTSRVITGTQYIPTGPAGRVPTPASVEQYRKAPNLYLNIYKTPTYTISEGFDGTTVWSQDQNGRVTEPVKLDADRARRSADFYEPLTLKQEYAGMAVRGVDIVNGHDVYVVVGTPQGDTPETLYFDVQTGLLLRRMTYLTTPTGGSPFKRNYDDYRDSSGVKVPFTTLMDPAGARTLLWPQSTLRVTTVKDNVEIDNSRFAKPASSTANAPR